MLADFYQRVTIVERDPLPTGASDRKGVPQGRHAHALLPRGAQILGDLFPGLLDELLADGVPVTDGPEERWFRFSGHVLCRTGAPDDRGYQPSRPYLEAQVHKRVRAMGNVVLRDRCDAVALVASDGRDRVTGVRVAQPDGAEETLTADLVVDATGRSGRTPAWLQQFGYAVPDEE